MDKVKNINIQKGLNLIFIEDDRFKANVMGAYLTMPLKRDTVTKNSILPDILRSATATYPKKDLITRHLQNLYGSDIVAIPYKIGEKQSLSFRTLYPKAKYLDEPVDRDILDFLLEVIFNPYLVDGGFDPRYTAIEKSVLEEKINAIKNNKGKYAYDRCIKAMFEGEDYSISPKGYIEDIAEMTEKNLYTHYQDMIKKANYTFVFAGDFEEGAITEKITKYMKGKDLSPIDLSVEKKHKSTKIKDIEEKMDIVQGKLVLGYTSNISNADESYYDFLMGCNILGMGAHGKLFRNVREKHSLCYSISASPQREKGTMIVKSGIEHENKDRVVELINREIQDIKDGNITDEEFENAQKFYINQLRTMTDDLLSFSEFCYSQSITPNPKTVEQIIEIVKSTDKHKVSESLFDVKLDTKYFLTK